MAAFFYENILNICVCREFIVTLSLDIIAISLY